MTRSWRPPPPTAKNYPAPRRRQAGRAADFRNPESGERPIPSSGPSMPATPSRPCRRLPARRSSPCAPPPSKRPGEGGSAAIEKIAAAADPGTVEICGRGAVEIRTPRTHLRQDRDLGRPRPGLGGEFQADRDKSPTGCMPRWAPAAPRWMRAMCPMIIRWARPARWWRPIFIWRWAFPAPSSIWPA